MDFNQLSHFFRKTFSMNVRGLILTEWIKVIIIYQKSSTSLEIRKCHNDQQKKAIQVRGDT